MSLEPHSPSDLTPQKREPRNDRISLSEERLRADLAVRTHSPRISASLLPIKDEAPSDILLQCLAATRVGVDMLHFDVLGGEGQRTSVTDEGSADTSRQLTPELLKNMQRAFQQMQARFQSDIHIMDPVPSLTAITQWLRAGADYLTVHWEAFEDKSRLKDLLEFVVTLGGKAGLAIRPDVNLDQVVDFIRRYPELVALVNQAGVIPCFGGQTFNFGVLNNIRALRELREREGLDFQIMVDGGIESEISGPKCFSSGADILVAGSAFFGNGRRDALTMTSALDALKRSTPNVETDVYDILADRIKSLREHKQGKLWIAVESYHAGGKTYTAGKLQERLEALGLHPVVVGLDLSWTDRQRRAAWRKEAYEAKACGADHAYFHPLSQKTPMHWRKAHSEQMLEQLREAEEGTVTIPDCYQFNLKGDTDGQVRFRIHPDSIILVEGVYVSSMKRRPWDLKIYIDSDPVVAKERAVLRDAIKTRRAPTDTLELYQDVYERAYEEYLQQYKPKEAADIVIDHNDVDETKMIRNARIVRASAPLIFLECLGEDCSTQQAISRTNLCSHCGSELQNKILGVSNFLDLIDDSYRSMWRYRRLMPVKPENIVTADEGMTPVTFLTETSRKLGVNIWAKLETKNPTGTFKDREGSYVVSMSRQFGQENLVMQSTGNTAIAVAHYAGLAGIPSWSFIPELSAYKLLMPEKKASSKIIAVKGHPIDVKALAEDFAACFKFPKISPFYERCEANATMGYEIGEDLLRGNLAEQDRLRGGSFDYYVQTLSAGMGLIGYFAAMERLREWTNGRIKVPHIVAVEISEFAPAHAALREDRERVGEDVATPYFPNRPLFEPTLWTTNITRYYPHLRRMLKSSKGIIDSVTPEEVRTTIDRSEIASELAALGYALSDTENSSFIGFAGLAKKVAQGEIPKGSNIILLITGKAKRDDFILHSPDLVALPDQDRPEDIMAALKVPLGHQAGGDGIS